MLFSAFHMYEIALANYSALLNLSHLMKALFF